VRSIVLNVRKSVSDINIDQQTILQEVSTMPPTPWTNQNAAQWISESIRLQQNNDEPIGLQQKNDEPIRLKQIKL